MARQQNWARGYGSSQTRKRSWGLAPLAALIAVAALGYVLIDRGYVTVPGLERTAYQQSVRAAFGLCTGAGGTCVIDGDTIRLDGQPIRIADIDTPEVRNFGCAEEKALGDQATMRILDLVNQGEFSMTLWDHRDEDMYGRKLRVLSRDGQSLGMILVAEGLARPWDGARRSWCG